VGAPQAPQKRAPAGNSTPQFMQYLFIIDLR